MNEDMSMRDGSDTGEAVNLDAQGAAVIVQQAGERARRELAIRRPVLFVIWGLVVLIGYGTMWLTARDQHAYHGPAGWTLLLDLLLIVAAAGASANVVDSAASGVTGRSELQRWTFALALAVGYAALESEKLALRHAGADITQQSLFGQAVPLLLTGLVCLATAASTRTLNWPRLIIGCWLLAVAGSGVWAGPADSLAVCAFAGGGGILLMAAIEPRLRRS
jgi:hypothetical protein